ncbi:MULTISPECIES: arsenate reductase ArsC [Spiribacter]|uniref:arsenate reductase ArsC n=1 Tax=Spiribacter TaxID=1335745 RepID=UPI001330BEC5|nr:MULTISPECIES: arsenate reductase ArsC [Spiribacter]KAF0282106.1 ArsR family transcriptional regulator [Spiribacter roseus]KAF0285730.1 ArsR family transcriptional regulator [Spiribacter sp. SSL99]
MAHYNVLFLCTGNSARSIIAEALLNRMGNGRFTAYSAGSMATGTVNPLALQVLERMDLPTKGLYSKNWDVFAGDDAPAMDFIFTVCDQAAAEPCPVWPGQPMTAHWGLPDPAAVEGTEEERLRAFRDTAAALRRRLGLLMNLPMESLDRLKLAHALEDIGHSQETDHDGSDRAVD